MCGVVGHISFSGSEPDSKGVESATDALRHRGPDGGGVKTFAHACLGHRRLSIIDVEHSTQPWCTANDRYSLVFNGEIYNYLELKKHLQGLGYQFTSSGDTEVLMCMYVHYGAKCLERLNGMFSFAIWDNKNKELFLARDRVGKKPLYYSCFESNIVFTSELAAFRNFSNIDLSLDYQAVHDYFAYQFIPGNITIYQGIKKLKPAHYAIFNTDGLRLERYWSFPKPEKGQKCFSESREELVSLIDDAVKIRMRSDVPVGTFLSGGLDSSIIVSTLHRLGIPTDTFTVGFSDSTFDERDMACLVAGKFNTCHHDEIVDIDPCMIMDRYIHHFGEPFADPSAVPTWFLCERTRQSVTVALSGDGADELFCGYNRYLASRYIRLFQKMPQTVRDHFIEPIVMRLKETDGYYGASNIRKMKLFLQMVSRMQDTPGDLLPQTFTLGERKKLLNPELIEAKGADHVKQLGLSGLELETQMMITDLHTYLCEDILTKTDRMSMAHSLEVRSPFLDHRIIEFACSLPIGFKRRGRVQKYILREAYKHQLPNEVLDRGKHGFAVPLGSWFRNELQSLFESVVLEVTCPNFLNQNEIMRIWDEHQQGNRDHGFKLWSILIFFYWYANRLQNETT